MNASRWGLALFALLSLVAYGCSQQAPAKDAQTTLCGDCGQIKASEACCAKDAEKCGECSLVKGSPGCCHIEKGTDVVLCTKCGQVKSSDACCAEDADKCDKCGLAKGSPGCCTI